MEDEDGEGGGRGWRDGGRGAPGRKAESDSLLHVGGWLDEGVTEETKKHLLPLSSATTCWRWSSLSAGDEPAAHPGDPRSPVSRRARVHDGGNESSPFT